MASPDVQSDDLIDELECSVCKESFVDPRYLSCFHYFCFKCLVAVNKITIKSITCPLCRKVTSLPREGVKGLRKNDLISSLQHKLSHPTQSKNPTCQDKSVDPQHHVQRDASFYCETCQSAVCGECGMRNHRDSSQHKTVPINEALLSMKQTMKYLHRVGKDKEKQQNDHCELVEAKVDDIRQSLALLRTLVDSSISQELDLIKQRERALQKQLSDIESTILKALTKNSSNVEPTRSTVSTKKGTPLSELNNETENIISSDNSKRVLQQYKIIYENYEGLLKQNDTPMNELVMYSLGRLSEFTDKLQFKRTNDPSTKCVGKLTWQTEWMVKEEVLEPGFEIKPSSLSVLFNGNVVIGFHSDIGMVEYNKDCKYCINGCVQGVKGVRSVAALPNESCIVLNKAGSVYTVSEGKAKLIIPPDDQLDIAISAAADAKGNVLLLYKNHLNMYAPDGNLVKTISFRDTFLVKTDSQSTRMWVHSTADVLTDQETQITILVNDGGVVRLYQLMTTLSGKRSVREIELPDDSPTASKRFGGFDKQGNIFLAHVCEKFVSIRRYSADDFTSEDVVDDLNVTMSESDQIHLDAADPTCLYMCTPTKLTVFRRETIEEFLKNNDLL